MGKLSLYKKREEGLGTRLASALASPLYLIPGYRVPIGFVFMFVDHAVPEVKPPVAKPSEDVPPPSRMTPPPIPTSPSPSPEDREPEGKCSI